MPHPRWFVTVLCPRTGEITATDRHYPLAVASEVVSDSPT
jgi:hypothetical protein